MPYGLLQKPNYISCPLRFPVKIIKSFFLLKKLTCDSIELPDVGHAGPPNVGCVGVFEGEALLLCILRLHLLQLGPG